METIYADTFEDRAFGCIIGAFIGDATGSYLEGYKTNVNDNTMTKCMKMPGGGPNNVGPGQITEAGELIMCQI